MELSSEHHLQEMATDSSSVLEDMLICSTKAQQERKPRPQQAEQALKCPRCDSTNTKFCYYNNYSLTQPRYFCKSCRRYWTNGGTLRNIPVGGGCRKNNKIRPSSSSRRSSTTTTTSNNSDHHHLHQLQPQPHHNYHNMLLNSLSAVDQNHTRQNYNNWPLSANFSSQMSSYNNDHQYHDQPAACSSSTDLSQLVFARLQKQQPSGGGGGGGYDHDHHHHGHIDQHNHNNNNNNLSLLGNFSNSHVRNLMGLNDNISDGRGHHGFLEGLKTNLVLEQTQLFQNSNSTNFQNLYNGGFGSNGSSTTTASCSMSNISRDQMMTIPCEDYLGRVSGSFGAPKNAGLLLKQEDYSNNIHHQLIRNDIHNNNPIRSSQILWGGAAAAAARFPLPQIDANSSINNEHDHDINIVDHSINSINNYNMVDNNAANELGAREINMNVFAAAPVIWQGLINSPLM